MARRKHPHLVATRLTTEQRDTTVFAASLDGITVTEFIRRALLPVVRARISQATSLRTASVARDETDLPPRAVPHPMLVPAPVEGREGRASSGTRATA